MNLKQLQMPHMKETVGEQTRDLQFRERSFKQILKEFKASMRRAFHEEDEIERFCSTRGMPPAVLEELMSGNPLALCIPEQYGGFGGSIKENIAFMSAAAYESLPLSLILGINNALFIQPVAKYGQEVVKQELFNQFLNERCMGGLMITEPGFGSDALNMQTSFSEQDGFFHLKGTKHWAGLTGMAELWVLTARKEAGQNNLMRDIDMFICDVKAPRQKIIVEEYFENLGLYQIPYGRNRIDVYIPEEQRLIPQTTGVQMLLDMLHRSRFQFPGMGLGFIRRILDEAISHTKSRLVGNKNLSSYDQVQNRLSHLQANFTLCSAFCLKSGEIAGMKDNLASLGLEANIIKSVTSDIMQESAQSLLQLFGAKGYKLNNIAGRSVVDSRPFQIFEGSNDILNHQIADSLLKLMKTAKEKSLYRFLRGYAPRAADRIKELVSFNLDTGFPQRKLVKFGQVISRIVSMDLVLYLEEKGFRKDLIDNTLIILKQHISILLNSLHFESSPKVVFEYEQDSYWFDFSNL
jgi:alkylation response protein AidB-like acyl-CoA dehydrogenase